MYRELVVSCVINADILRIFIIYIYDKQKHEITFANFRVLKYTFYDKVDKKIARRNHHNTRLILRRILVGQVSFYL